MLFDTDFVKAARHLRLQSQNRLRHCKKSQSVFCDHKNATKALNKFGFRRLKAKNTIESFISSLLT